MPTQFLGNSQTCHFTAINIETEKCLIVLLPISELQELRSQH